MRVVRAPLSAVYGVLGLSRALLHAHAWYTLGIWGASLIFGRERPRAPATTPEEAPRIAVLVVAHDEAPVIEASVRSLSNQRYPAERFEVFVVADNCSDDTARRAEAAGARVIVRHSGGARGKPAAVAFGVAEVSARGAWDAIAVFDADNVADADFLPAVAARLRAGERVVQGFVDAKNPDASWVSGFGAIGFWVIDGLVERPRERLGLSAALMGTGYAAEPELFATLLAPENALADDLEASARLALSRVRVAYEPQARTLDERPVAMNASVQQRRRWMQGRWATAERWLPTLLAASLSPGQTVLDRLNTLDVAVRLLSPSLLFTAVTLGASSSAELALRAALGDGGGDSARRGLRLAFVYFLSAVPAVARHARGPGIWLLYALQPGFVLRSIPIAIYGFVRRRSSTWAHTKHGVEGA
ncbi:MAG: glycosyltransferase family 2 protein [Polyangiaceae bacterium]